MSSTIKKNKNYFEILIISMFWLLVFSSPILFGRRGNTIDWGNVILVWKNNSPLLLLFVVNRFILVPKFLFNNKLIKYFTSVIGLIAILVFGFTFLFRQPNKEILGQNPKNNIVTRQLPQRNPNEMHPQPPPGHNNIHQTPPENNNILNSPIQPPPVNNPPHNLPPFANLLILSVLVVGFDTGLRTSTKWAKNEKEKLKLSKENMESKLAFLQNQISPHFFMNTLNNIHALVDIDTEEAKEAIIKLSKLMRYMLYESNSSKISLHQEMEFIKSYVELMKLRLTDQVELVVDIPNILPKVNIPPLLTISFIENAFKYGISYETASFVHIKVNISENRLYFKIENSINLKNTKEKKSGIGLDNTKKRLELLFGKDYELSIKNDDKKFEVNLNIPI